MLHSQFDIPRVQLKCGLVIYWSLNTRKHDYSQNLQIQKYWDTRDCRCWNLEQKKQTVWNNSVSQAPSVNRNGKSLFWVKTSHLDRSSSISSFTVPVQMKSHNLKHRLYIPSPDFRKWGGVQPHWVYQCLWGGDGQEFHVPRLNITNNLTCPSHVDTAR